MIRIAESTVDADGSCNACPEREGVVYVLKFEKPRSSASIEVRLCTACRVELISGRPNPKGRSDDTP